MPYLKTESVLGVFSPDLCNKKVNPRGNYIYWAFGLGHPLTCTKSMNQQPVFSSINKLLIGSTLREASVERVSVSRPALANDIYLNTRELFCGGCLMFKEERYTIKHICILSSQKIQRDTLHQKQLNNECLASTTKYW